MRTVLPVALAALLAAPMLAAAAGPRPSAAKSTKPSQRRPSARAAKPRAKVRPIPHAKARAKAVAPQPAPAASAHMAALLRAYVHGGSNKYEKKVARKMGEQPGSKAAAARLLSRIEAAPASRRRSALGGKFLPTTVKRSDLSNSISEAAAHHSDLMYLTPVISLPPQGVSLPTTFTLERTGLVTTASEDADGTDELTTLGIIAVPLSGGGFTLTTVELGAAESAAVGTHAMSAMLYTGKATDAVIITALIEDDGGNAAAAAAEVETLVGLAASVAETMPGTDRLAILKTMVDYTIALDGVGADSGRAARSVVATPIASGEWAGMWGADTTAAGDVSYKAAIPHSMGTGQYELLLNVPAQLPAMKTVRLSLSDFEHVGESSPYATVSGFEVRAGIGDKGHTFLDFPVGAKALARKVIDGNIELSVSGTVHYSIDYPDHIDSLCTPKPNEPWTMRKRRRERCQKKKKSFKKQHNLENSRPLDFAGGSATTYTTTFSTPLGGFKPGTNPKKPTAPSATQQPTAPPIRSRTAKGSAKPWASVKLTAKSS